MLLLAFVAVFLSSERVTSSHPLTNSFHAFHISKTDLAFKPKEKSVEITMHVFIDDLETALEKQGNSKLFVGSEKEKPEAKSLIVNYLQQNFKIQINGKKVNYAFVGTEPTTDKQAIWMYLEIKNVRDIKNITVENSVLTELHSDQKNIVQINVPTKKQGYFTLDRNQPSDTARF